MNQSILLPEINFMEFRSRLNSGLNHTILIKHKE